MLKTARWCFFILVCLSLLAPLWVFKDLLFPYVTSKAFFFRICIEVALPFYVYLLIREPKLRPNLKNPLSILVLVFLIINIVSSFTGVDLTRSLWGNFERMGGTFYLGHLCALYFYVLALGQMQGLFLRRFLKFLLLTALVVALNGIFGWLHLPILVQDPSLPGRVSSTLGNPIYLGSYLIVPLFLAWFFARSAETKARAFGYYFLGLLFLLGAFLSGTRGALVGLIAGAFIASAAYLYYSPAGKIKRYGIVILGLFVVVSGLLFAYNKYLPGSTLSRIFKLEDSNTEARLIQWKIALSGYKDHPILGTGPENYYIIANQYYNPELAKYDRSWFDKPHNYLLEILITNGALGLLAYLAILVFTVIALYRGYKNGFYGLAEFAFMLAALLAYQIQNLTVFDTVPASLTFYAFLGFAGYIWDVSASQAKQNKLPALSGNDALSAAAFLVTALVMAYTVYAANAVPLKIASDVNYGYAYSGVDPSQALDFFNDALSEPFNFDKSETAGKLSDFATSFARGATPDQQQLAVKVLDTAASALNDSLSVEPYNPITWERLAAVYMYKGIQANGKVSLDPRAEASVNKAISLAPKREEGYVTLAQIRALEGNFTEADNILKTTIDSYPQDPALKIQLATYLRYQGKLDDAASLFEQALAQGYTASSYSDVKWLVNYYAQKQDFQKAISLQMQAAKAEPNNTQVFVDLAYLYAQAGQADAARSLAEEIIKIDPSQQKAMQALIASLPTASTTTPAK